MRAVSIGAAPSLLHSEEQRSCFKSQDDQADFSDSDSSEAFLSVRGLVAPPNTGAGLQPELMFCLDGDEVAGPAASAAAEVSTLVSWGSSGLEDVSLCSEVEAGAAGVAMRPVSLRLVAERVSHSWLEVVPLSVAGTAAALAGEEVVVEAEVETSLSSSSSPKTPCP